MTGIDRLKKTGIFRAGTPKQGFTYKKADGKKVTADDVARIRALKIPPAWTNVAINASPMGFVESRANLAPAFTTNTSQSSLGRNNLPSPATGEALNELGKRS